MKKLVISTSRFKQKITKNELYNLLDLFIDLIYSQKPISLASFLLVLVSAPAICTFIFIQYLIFLFILLWHCISVFVGFFSFEIIRYKRKIKINTMYFSWCELVYIYLIDFPKLQAFLVIYNILNKKIAKKNLNELFERFIFAQVPGWSYNLFIKMYWFYQNIVYALESVNWKPPPPPFFFVFIFFGSLKDQVGYFVSVTLNPLINVIEGYRIIIKSRSIKLNPYETQTLLHNYKFLLKKQNLNIEDIFNQLIVDKFQNKSLNIIKNMSMGKFFMMNQTQFMGANFFEHNHIFFTAINERFKILNFDKSNPLFYKKIVLGYSYTHDVSLFVQNTKIDGRAITQYVLPDNIKMPQKPTFAFTTACDYTILNSKIPVKHFQDHGLRTLLDLLQFQLLNNLKLTIGLEKIIQSDIVMIQTQKGRERRFVSLENLCKNGCFYIDSERYLNDDYFQFLSDTEDILKNYQNHIHKGIKRELDFFHSNYENLNIYPLGDSPEKSYYDNIAQLDDLIKNDTRFLNQSKVDFFEHLNDSAPATLIGKFNTLWNRLNWEEIEERMILLKNKNNFPEN